MKALLPILLAGLALLAGPPARACPICLGITIRPPCFAEQIIAAESLVIARAAGDGTFIVETRLRGERPAPGDRLELPGKSIGSRVLLATAAGASTTADLGPYTPALHDFLRIVLPLRRFDPADEAGWDRQLDLFQPFLAHTDPRVASSAWTCWARAPFAVLRRHRTLPPRATLLSWLDDPTRTGEASLYWSLLGLQADAAVKHRLRESVLTSWKNGNSTHLAAMLDAELSANGKSAVDFIVRHYIGDRDRTLDEIQAALLALRMHAIDGAAGLHEPVATAFETFVEVRRPLGGLVAADLQTWQRWKASRQFLEMLAAGETIYPPGRPAILAYLAACPDPATADALALIRKESP